MVAACERVVGAPRRLERTAYLLVPRPRTDWLRVTPRRAFDTGVFDGATVPTPLPLVSASRTDSSWRLMRRRRRSKLDLRGGGRTRSESFSLICFSRSETEECSNNVVRLPMGDKADTELRGDLALGLDPGGKTSSAGTVSPSVRESFAIFVRRASSSSRFIRALLCTLTGDSGLRIGGKLPIVSAVIVEMTDMLSASFSSEEGPLALRRERFPLPPLLLQSSLSTGKPRKSGERPVAGTDIDDCDAAGCRAGSVCARVCCAFEPRFRVRCRPALRYLCGVPLFFAIGSRNTPNSASIGVKKFCSTAYTSSCPSIGDITMGVSPRTLLSLRVERISRFRARGESVFSVNGTGTRECSGAVAQRVRSKTVAVAEREWNGDFGDE